MSNSLPKCTSEDSNELDKPSNPSFNYSPLGSLGPQLMPYSELHLPLKGCVCMNTYIYIYMFSTYTEKIQLRDAELDRILVLFILENLDEMAQYYLMDLSGDRKRLPCVNGFVKFLLLSNIKIKEICFFATAGSPQHKYICSLSQQLSRIICGHR